MRKFLILLLLISTPVYAEKYMVTKNDGSVVIIDKVSGSSDSLSDVLRDMGLSGLPIELVTENDIKKVSSESDRYWKRGVIDKIEIDTFKKQADINSRLAKEAERDSVLAKLRISRDIEGIKNRLRT